eukprot:1019983-Prorocentrum_minimum.AAC.1
MDCDWSADAVYSHMYIHSCLTRSLAGMCGNVGVADDRSAIPASHGTHRFVDVGLYATAALKRWTVLLVRN